MTDDLRRGLGLLVVAVICGFVAAVFGLGGDATALDAISGIAVFAGVAAGLVGLIFIAKELLKPSAKNG